MFEWIKLNDRLPEPFQHVLVFRKHHEWEQLVAFFDPQYHYHQELGYAPGWGNEEGEVVGVTHWRPLPDPPRTLWVWTPNESTTCSCGNDLPLPNNKQYVLCPQCDELWINLGKSGKPVEDGYTKEIRQYYKWKTA